MLEHARNDKAQIYQDRFDEPIEYVKAKLPKDNQQRNGLLAYAYYRKKDFPKAMEYYIEKEEYEECSKIKILINKL